MQHVRSSVVDRISTLGRTIALLLFSGAAIAVAFSLLGLLDVARDREGRAAPDPVMEVGGEGRVDVPPSEASMQVGVRGCAGGPSGALQEANRSAAAIISSVRKVGVPQRDVAQSGAHTYREGGTDPRWCTDVEVSVRVRKLDDLSGAIAAIGGHRTGVNRLRGPHFDYGADGELEQQALAKAVSAARAKADDAAKRTGMRVTGVRTITEGEAFVERPDSRDGADFDGRYKGEKSATVAFAASLDDAEQLAVATSSGHATAHADVAVVFTLERDG